MMEPAASHDQDEHGDEDGQPPPEPLWASTPLSPRRRESAAGRGLPPAQHHRAIGTTRGAPARSRLPDETSDNEYYVYSVSHLSFYTPRAPARKAPPVQWTDSILPARQSQGPLVAHAGKRLRGPPRPMFSAHPERRRAARTVAHTRPFRPRRGSTTTAPVALAAWDQVEGRCTTLACEVRCSWTYDSEPT
jgi:hypothetical protein